jgi:hypothetical protein
MSQIPGIELKHANFQGFTRWAGCLVAAKSEKKNM